MPHPLITTLTALMLAGCHHQTDKAAAPGAGTLPPVAVQAPPRDVASPSVPFRTLLRSVHFVYEGEAQNAVIRSATDWEAFLASHPHNEPGTFSLDFAREQGILVQLGPQPTGAIRVEIVSIEERPDHFVVHAVRWLPPPGLVTEDIGHPTHYVAMARSDKPVTFAPLVEATPSERP